MKEERKCSHCGSKTKTCSTEIGILCNKHYLQYTRYGKLKDRTKNDPNEIIDYENYCEIILYDKNSEESCRAIIDIEDKHLIFNKKWCINTSGYVITGSTSPFIYLHRLIMDAQEGDYIDHLEGNKLDNRKSKLKICTNQENSQNKTKVPSDNTSGVLGVHFDKSRNKWKVEIGINGKNKYIGRFSLLEDAIIARKEAEKKYFKNISYVTNQT